MKFLFFSIFYTVVSLTPLQITKRFFDAMNEYKQGNVFKKGLSIHQNKPNFDTSLVLSNLEYGSNISCFRIPSVVNNNNNIIVFSEARINSCEDCSITGIISKKSLDGGITWSDPVWVVTPNNRGGNFVPVYDKNRNVIIAHYSRGGHKINNNKWDCIPALVNYQIKSYDWGETWSYPQNISKFLNNYTGLLNGPGNAGLVINTKNNTRYIFAGHYGTAERPNGGVITYYSDDFGNSYQLSNTYLLGMDEPSIYQINNDVILNMRTGFGFRGISYSNNFGVNWKKINLDYELNDPICEASTNVIDGHILFVNPNMKYARSNLTLKYQSQNDNLWNTIQIVDESVFSDYSVITEKFVLNNEEYFGVIWGYAIYTYPFRPWAITGWGLKITRIPLSLINSK